MSATGYLGHSGSELDRSLCSHVAELYKEAVVYFDEQAQNYVGKSRR